MVTAAVVERSFAMTPNLFEYAREKLNSINIRFNGIEITKKDEIRLTGQILRVFECLKDGSWWTLEDLSQETGDPHASVSAQLRNLRKMRFGCHNIEKRNLGYGLWEYRMVV